MKTNDGKSGLRYIFTETTECECDTRCTFCGGSPTPTQFTVSSPHEADPEGVFVVCGKCVGALREKGWSGLYHKLQRRELRLSKESARLRQQISTIAEFGIEDNTTIVIAEAEDCAA